MAVCISDQVFSHNCKSINTHCKADGSSPPRALHRTVILQWCTLTKLCPSWVPRALPSTAPLAPTFPWWTHVLFLLLPKRSFFLTSVLPVFVLLGFFVCLFLFFGICYSKWLFLCNPYCICIHTTVYWHAFLLLRRRNLQCDLLLLITFSVPDCLYTLRMMAHNYGLLWSSITAAFFLPKDQEKKRRMNDSAGYSSMLLYGLIMKKTCTMLFQAIA